MADSLDRLVRKEVSLGTIREKQPPNEHIGISQIAPWLDVDTDDVIFDYLGDGLQDGMAPARAEDAEAELAQKDELLYGQGRAAIIDWSLKDRYSTSDVTRYREDLYINTLTQGRNSELNRNLNFVGKTQADFEKRLARHDTLRRRKLDNRMEWLIMQSIEKGGIRYNDGKIKFTVDFERPADQQDQAPTSGDWVPGNDDFDPIGDLIDIQQEMFDKYGVRPRRAITSRKTLNRLWKSPRFLARFSPVVGGTPSAPIDVKYLSADFGPDAAQAVVAAQTGVRFIEYDGIFRTRVPGTTNTQNIRFLDEDKIYFLPEEGDLGEIDDTEIGFAKMLTSPHPEGNWTSGYYEWEDETRDPWMRVRGSGIKAFPVFPYMEYTYTLQVENA